MGSRGRLITWAFSLIGWAVGIEQWAANNQSRGETADELDPSQTIDPMSEKEQTSEVRSFKYRNSDHYYK
jgi:hypothetical protein